MKKLTSKQTISDSVTHKKRNKLVNMGLLVMFIAYTGLAIWMGANFDFQSPIVFQSPITRKVTSPIIRNDTPSTIQIPSNSPTPTPNKKRTQGLVTKVYASDGYVDISKIYQLESSSGRNDSCKNQGKFNGYGYGQNKHVWNCFDTFEEVTNKVQAWFNDKQAKGYSIEEALCYYNQGLKVSDCKYAENYKSL